MNPDAVHQAAREKAAELSEFFAEVQTSVKKAELTLNTLFLADACESCFIDLERHMDFHGIEMPDRHKRAAFLFKWLSRIRPINVSCFTRGKGEGKIIHINSYFALLAALGELEVDMFAFAPGKIAQHMIYAGACRDIHPETWAMIFVRRRCNIHENKKPRI